jgi:transglutaminase-like putative cysteine protease
MAIRVALHHRTSYSYDKPVALSPHEVRLRPAPHARTPILSYSLTVTPDDHFINWQQDPYGNYIGRFVFPEKTEKLEFTVDLIADMTVINPFDFFVEKYAEQFPFKYPPQLSVELGAYLHLDQQGPLVQAWVEKTRSELLEKALPTNDFLVAINQRLQQQIGYLLRMEPGVQTPEETIKKASGSCRDSAWLLVQILRSLGLAARFVSGYLIQLRPDQESLDGPSGTAVDFTDLHAWTEVYIPGAGWIGLDPTSGMLASEGHIPLACTAMPSSAAPVSGASDKAEVTFFHEMTITRIHEDPRVTKPYSETDWKAIDRLGAQVDADLKRNDVRLTQGGEPTFVSIDDMDGPEWNTEAHGAKKRELAGQLMHRLKNHFAPGGMLHYGQGKWYPGEPLPRWALNIYWRIDGQPMWRDATLFADENKPDGYGSAEAASFAAELVKALSLPAGSQIAAYEDVLVQARLEQALPVNLDPLIANLDAPEQRKRLARLLEQGLGAVVGYVLPLAPTEFDPGVMLGTAWRSSAWPIKREHLYLIDGDSPMGLRLPLNSLPWVLPDEITVDFDVDTFAPRAALASLKRNAYDTLRMKVEKGDKSSRSQRSQRTVLAQAKREARATLRRLAAKPLAKPDVKATKAVIAKTAPRDVIHTALCVQVRDGRLHIFMPPLKRIEDYLALVNSVEATAAKLQLKLWIEGYGPPRDPRIKLLSVTPDPGVIEVNVHPSASWKELVYTMSTLYQEARLTRLGTEKFMVDGRHTGTGGGNHATLGGATAEDSPMLRRPDLLKSLITSWQNHPALS